MNAKEDVYLRKKPCFTAVKEVIEVYVVIIYKYIYCPSIVSVVIIYKLIYCPSFVSVVIIYQYI